MYIILGLSGSGSESCIVTNVQDVVLTTSKPTVLNLCNFEIDNAQGFPVSIVRNAKSHQRLL